MCLDDLGETLWRVKMIPFISRVVQSENYLINGILQLD